MTLTPETSGGLALARLGVGMRGWWGCQRLTLRSRQWVHNPSAHTNTHTHTRVRDSSCVSDATDRCYCPVPAVPYLSPQVSGAASGALMTHTHVHTHSFTHPLLQLSHRQSLTHQIYVLCASAHTHSSSSISACVCVCVCVCAGRGRVYHLEECTVFGNVKSSPQWSGVVQTHSVLLDGPEIPLCAPRGKREEFKCFNMLSHCWGSNTTVCVCVCVCVCVSECVCVCVSECQHVFVCVCPLDLNTTQILPH